MLDASPQHQTWDLDLELLPPAHPDQACVGNHWQPSGDNQEAFSLIEDIAAAQKFIWGLQQVTFSNNNLSEDLQYHLCHPIKAEPDLEDPDLWLSIKLYMGAGGESEHLYNEMHSSILEQHPNDLILSFHNIKWKIEELTGITSIVHDMCVNSCLAYTGPYSTLSTCPYCNKPWYKVLSSHKHKDKLVL